MAETEYSLRVSVSRGTTVSSALQRVHRNRRERNSKVTGFSPGAPGPRSCRPRRPCPWSATLPPVGRLATPQFGHWAGRTSSGDGSFSNHPLTSSSLRTTPRMLRVPFLNGSMRSTTRGVFVHAPSHLFSLMSRFVSAGSPALRLKGANTAPVPLRQIQLFDGNAIACKIPTRR